MIKLNLKKVVIVALGLALFLYPLAKAQQVELKEKPLTPARGHYAALEKLSSGQQNNPAWDEQKFPYNAESHDRALNAKPYYLSKLLIKDIKLPEPPANSSVQTKAELNYLLQLQQHRTKIDVDAALEMAGVFYSIKTKPGDESYAQYRKNLFFIGRSIGTWFHPDSLPKTADFIAHVWQDASYFIWGNKYKYLRIRPYKLDSRLQNLQDTEWAAYPSGHATNSYVNAFIYQELAPEFADVFLKDAYDMAHSREIIGVHYPSDSEAGRILARQLVNMLMKNEKFQADFANVKKEWQSKSLGYFGEVVVEKSLTKPTSTSCGSSAQSTTKSDCKTDTSCKN
jgi:acid phosphatase (class A)